MSKQKTVGVWLTSALLACSLMAPIATGAAPERDAERSSQQQAKQEHLNHKHAHKHSHKKMTSEEIKQMRLEKLKRLAAYFDIETEGKTLDQLKEEVDQAKREQPEKWEAFKQEFRAKKLEKIREYAKQKGIDVEGKTLEQLHDELHELEERSNHR